MFSLFRVCVLVTFMISILLPSNTFALTSKYDKGVKVADGPKLEYESPDRFTPFTLIDAPEDIGYWTSIIPYPEDRNEDMYIVMPTLGLISPVVFVPEGTADFNNMVTGQEIDINKYLPEGVMHYPSTGLPGEVANPVIFGHSNYFKNKPGKYKSIFADIMNLDVDPSDEVWIYIKNNNGSYDMQKYDIEKSYETVPTDVGVITPRGGKELTVFACTDGLNGRWILKARLIESNEILITYPMKYEMHDVMQKMEEADKVKKQNVILEGVKRIESIRSTMGNNNTTADKYKKYILKYIEEKLVVLY